jgi:glycerol-3-phosphate cytidylyltransferase
MQGDRVRQGVVGYVPGAWDMFHIGHLNLLKRARENCDWLVAGVVTDATLFAMKGKYPIVAMEERLAIVEAIGIVDEAVVDESANKLAAWEQVHFDVLFKGDDWRGTAKGKTLEQTLATVGARVHYFPYTLHTSSTELRRVLAEW